MGLLAKIFGHRSVPALKQPAFPFFVATDDRALTALERAVVERMLEGAPEVYRAQAEGLKVVGRCGCEECPIIFFEKHGQGDEEADLLTYFGRDVFGGLVAVVLMEKEGRLSQLDSYSIDGHYPWAIPEANKLEPYT